MLTSSYVKELSYPDFVGLINQWNVLPGSYTTLSKWATYSGLNKASRLLEVACTTGFSSRELATLTGCKIVGFDLSERSVANAIYNKNVYAPGIDAQYYSMDGLTFEPKEKFTHIAVGASLKFFDDPKEIFNRCIGWLEDGGMLLASPFYIERPVPQSLIQKARKVFGITPTLEGYHEIMDLYNKLEIIYEDRKELLQETDEEIKYYCQCTVEKAMHDLNIDENEIRRALFDRLFEVKMMSNELRPYQRYSVLVLRFRQSVYPNRFVELF